MSILLKEIQRAYIDEIEKQRQNERRAGLYHCRTKISDSGDFAIVASKTTILACVQ
jgi:hypothetical protein